MFGEEGGKKRRVWDGGVSTWSERESGEQTVLECSRLQ